MRWHHLFHTNMFNCLRKRKPFKSQPQKTKTLRRKIQSKETPPMDFTTASVYISSKHISLHWLIPDRAIEIGLSKHDSSVTITVSNAANILSRLAFGVTTADGFFSHVVILVVYVFLSGLNSILIIIWTTYWSYMIFAVLFGLLRGLYIIYMLLVVVDLVGKEQVGLGLGLTYTLNGLVFLVSIPVFAYYNEVTHSYTTTFILYGGLEIIGGFFLVTIPIYLCTKKANQMVKLAGQ